MQREKIVGRCLTKIRRGGPLAFLARGSKGCQLAVDATHGLCEQRKEQPRCKKSPEKSATMDVVSAK